MTILGMFFQVCKYYVLPVGSRTCTLRAVDSLSRYLRWPARHLRSQNVTGRTGRAATSPSSDLADVTLYGRLVFDVVEQSAAARPGPSRGTPAALRQQRASSTFGGRVTRHRSQGSRRRRVRHVYPTGCRHRCGACRQQDLPRGAAWRFTTSSAQSDGLAAGCCSVNRY